MSGDKVDHSAAERLKYPMYAVQSDGAVRMVPEQIDPQGEKGDGNVTFYRLEGKTPVPRNPGESSTRDHHVGETVFGTRGEKGSVLVSTVFLGVDHSFDGDGPPLLFETMVFPDGTWSEIGGERYSTWDEAEEGHARWVEKVKAEREEAAK